VRSPIDAGQSRGGGGGGRGRARRSSKWKNNKGEGREGGLGVRPLFKMYVAYGWPKLLSISPGSSQDDIVHLSVLQDWLLLVSSSRVQIWSASQHKTRLGQCTRDTPSLLEEGVNIEAVWSTDVKTIAVLVMLFLLHLFHKVLVVVAPPCEVYDVLAA
jgi:hypothetical protein